MISSEVLSEFGLRATPNVDSGGVIRRIIVPIDETLAPERAATVIEMLARAFSAEVVLVAGSEGDTGLPSGNRGLTTPASSRELTRAEKEARLASVNADLISRLPNVTTRFMSCYPPLAAIETAREDCGSLVVLATILGTPQEVNSLGQPSLPVFALEILNHMTVPVLFVGAQTRLPLVQSPEQGLRIGILDADLYASKGAQRYTLLLVEAFGGDLTVFIPMNGSTNGAARGSIAPLGGFAAWEQLQRSFGKRGVRVHMEALPGPSDSDESIRRLSERLDVLLIANPPQMAVQLGTMHEIAQLLASSFLAVLAVS